MNNNTAYDFSLFEDSQDNTDKSPTIKSVDTDTKKSQRKRYSPLSIAGFSLLIIIMLGVFSSLIISQANITETISQINDLNTEYIEECSIYTQLSMQVECKLSLPKIEKYAGNELGMSKLNTSQIKYINISDEDAGYIQKQAEPSWLTAIKEIFINFSELNK